MRTLYLVKEVNKEDIGRGSKKSGVVKKKKKQGMVSHCSS